MCVGGGAGVGGNRVRGPLCAWRTTSSAYLGRRKLNEIPIIFPFSFFPRRQNLDPSSDLGVELLTSCSIINLPGNANMVSVNALLLLLKWKMSQRRRSRFKSKSVQTFWYVLAICSQMAEIVILVLFCQNSTRKMCFYAFKLMCNRQTYQGTDTPY